MPGILYLIPTPLNEDSTETIPEYVKKIIYEMDEFVVEEEKTARRFLKRAGIKTPLDQLALYVYNEHTDENIVSAFLSPVLQGKNIGLLSEAGCPAVADPGALLVKHAHEKNIRVVPLVGPSSILLGLMASGFNGQNFYFHGYLPKDKNERIKKLKSLEHDALKKNQTQIFIEAPYRNNQVLQSVMECLNENTLLCIARDLTCSNEFIKTAPVSYWKKNIPELNKKPVVFLIG